MLHSIPLTVPDLIVVESLILRLIFFDHLCPWSSLVMVLVMLWSGTKEKHLMNSSLKLLDVLNTLLFVHMKEKESLRALLFFSCAAAKGAACSS